MYIIYVAGYTPEYVDLKHFTNKGPGTHDVAEGESEFLSDGMVHRCGPFGQHSLLFNISGNQRDGKTYLALVTTIGDGYSSKYLAIFSHQMNMTCEFSECELIRSDQYDSRIWYRYICPSSSSSHIVIKKLSYVSGKEVGDLCEVAVMNENSGNEFLNP